MKSRETFLGWAVFAAGECFPCSANTVTRDRLYLKAHALFKVGAIDAITLGDRHDCKTSINRRWKRERRLTLRRVYAR